MKKNNLVLVAFTLLSFFIVNYTEYKKYQVDQYLYGGYQTMIVKPSNVTNEQMILDLQESAIKNDITVKVVTQNDEIYTNKKETIKNVTTNELSLATSIDLSRTYYLEGSEKNTSEFAITMSEKGYDIEVPYLSLVEKGTYSYLILLIFVLTTTLMILSEFCIEKNYVLKARLLGHSSFKIYSKLIKSPLIKMIFLALTIYIFETLLKYNHTISILFLIISLAEVLIVYSLIDHFKLEHNFKNSKSVMVTTIILKASKVTLKYLMIIFITLTAVKTNQLVKDYLTVDEWNLLKDYYTVDVWMDPDNPIKEEEKNLAEISSDFYKDSTTNNDAILFSPVYEENTGFSGISQKLMVSNCNYLEMIKLDDSDNNQVMCSDKNLLLVPSSYSDAEIDEAINLLQEGIGYYKIPEYSGAFELSNYEIVRMKNNQFTNPFTNSYNKTKYVNDIIYVDHDKNLTGGFYSYSIDQGKFFYQGDYPFSSNVEKNFRNVVSKYSSFSNQIDILKYQVFYNMVILVVIILCYTLVSYTVITQKIANNSRLYLIKLLNPSSKNQLDFKLMIGQALESIVLLIIIQPFSRFINIKYLIVVCIMVNLVEYLFTRMITKKEIVKNIKKSMVRKYD